MQLNGHIQTAKEPQSKTYRQQTNHKVKHRELSYKLKTILDSDHHTPT